jgi:hypothetical protein
LSFELVYGHAFKAPPKGRVQPETHGVAGRHAIDDARPTTPENDIYHAGKAWQTPCEDPGQLSYS